MIGSVSGGLILALAALAISSRPRRLEPEQYGVHSQSCIATRRLHKPDGLDFRPKAGSPAIDASIELPSITDGFSGKAPDIGAPETGRPTPLYGPRN